MEMMPATRSLGSAAVCFMVGFSTLGIWPESDTAYAASVALLLGMFLFMALALADMVNRRS
jgi:hypothetical protein